MSFLSLEVVSGSRNCDQNERGAFNSSRMFLFQDWDVRVKEAAFSECLIKPLRQDGFYLFGVVFTRSRCKMWAVFQVLNVCVIKNLQYEAPSSESDLMKYYRSSYVRAVHVYPFVLLSFLSINLALWFYFKSLLLRCCGGNCNLFENFFWNNLFNSFYK